MLIMLIGNAGIVATISTMILGFVQISGSSSVFLRLLLLISGIFILILISRSRWIEKHLEKLIEQALKNTQSLT